MKKRKILSLIVAMLMVMSSCLPVLAVSYTTGSPVDTLTTEQIGDYTMVNNAATVTISDVSDATGLEFTTYQVIYAEYNSGTNELIYHLTDWAKDALVDATGLTSGTYLTEEAAIAAIQALYNQTGSTGKVTTEQNDIVNTLAAYVTANASTLTTKTWESITNNGNQIWTQDSGSATATLPVGSYLVVPTAENMAFLNMLVSVDATTADPQTNNKWAITARDAVLKGNTLGIDKRVEDTDGPAMASFSSSKDDAQIGDTISYKVVVDVPKFANNITDITFQVIDTPENVAIIESSVEVVASDSQGNNSSYTLKNDNTGVGDTADYNRSVGNDGKLTVNMAINYQAVFGDKSESTGSTVSYPFDKVTITYTATVLSTANVGTKNENEAILYYAHDVSGDLSKANSISAKAEVYTYELDLTKTDASSVGLAGAKFEILDSNGDPLTFVETATAEYVIYEASSYTVAPTTTNTLTVGSDGKLVIKGLDSATTYYIHETTAPAGYSLNSNYLQFVINADTPGTINDSSSVTQQAYSEAPGVTSQTDPAWTTITKDGTYSYIVNGTLQDTKIDAMPSTGSVGIIIFTVLGVCLMIVAVFLMTSSKDKKKQA